MCYYPHFQLHFGLPLRYAPEFSAYGLIDSLSEVNQFSLAFAGLQLFLLAPRREPSKHLNNDDVVIESKIR